MNNISQKIQTIRGTRSRRAFAEILGITESTLRNYENGTSFPNALLLTRMCTVLKISPTWLFIDQGPMLLKDWEQTQQAYKEKEVTVPVLGLAACGISGWFNAGAMAFRIPVPLLFKNTTDIFAVIAIGKSMVPAGIKEGFLLFCTPDTKADKDDIVFVEKKDGTASVKKFIKKDEKWLHLQGWLDPNKEGMQKAYVEKVAIDTVQTIANVILIQCKAIS